jgi:hypothetical protein
MALVEELLASYLNNRYNSEETDRKYTYEEPYCYATITIFSNEMKTSEPPPLALTALLSI